MADSQRIEKGQRAQNVLIKEASQTRKVAAAVKRQMSADNKVKRAAKKAQKDEEDRLKALDKKVNFDEEKG